MRFLTTSHPAKQLSTSMFTSSWGSPLSTQHFPEPVAKSSDTPQPHVLSHVQTSDVVTSATKRKGSAHAASKSAQFRGSLM